MATGATPPLSNLHISNYNQPNNHTIDLTLDDEPSSSLNNARENKRQRTDRFDVYKALKGNPFLPHASHSAPSPQPATGSMVQGAASQIDANINSHPQTLSDSHRPAFAPPPAGKIAPSVPSFIPASSILSNRMEADHPKRQIIDLTGSPSPPPSQPHFPNALPPNLPPKTPVCIGELTVTALVLYPVRYLQASDQQTHEADWAPIRFQYEHNPNKIGSVDTIHIKSPSLRGPDGGVIPGDAFGVVEQKVASSLGPMLGKGLIRIDGKVRRGMPNLPILPLTMLVYTPKGNIPVVADYLRQCGLLLEDPSRPYETQRLTNYHYFNPHHPPAGGHRIHVPPNKILQAQPRWFAPAVSGKSIEVQRSQVDELFKNFKSEDELEETEPPFEVATKLYPHQKKALTFLLEKEREQFGRDGKFSSLWQERVKSISRPSWFHVVTQKEVSEKPSEARGAILADDMGLGKTIACIALLAATMDVAASFANTPLELPPAPPHVDSEPPLTADHFVGGIWGMPGASESVGSAKAKAKAAKLQDKLEAEYVRACRIKAKSRGTLVICPLSTVANWEDQFREHWRGKVSVFGGASNCVSNSATATSQRSSPSPQSASCALTQQDVKTDSKPKRKYEGKPLRIYVYHGNARRPDPAFLADFDVIITTYATLATEFSKQSRSLLSAEDEDEEGSDEPGGIDVDERGNEVIRLPQPKKNPLKRKKPSLATLSTESTSALQSVHWFRIVLDEAHSIKEISTVASRASCDLMAERRLCLTGTPVQNKLDDVFALIKFLRLDPLNDKNIWTEFIGTPVKYGQPLGIARLQTIMRCITLRRTKESKTQDGQMILSLPPRRDELRYLKFDDQERKIYDRFFNESKAEFNELSDKNEVMKNYVGILQKILRLRQICDHFELVEGKGPGDLSQGSVTSYEDIVAAIEREGLTATRASAIFALLRESATTQCVECGTELSAAPDVMQNDLDDNTAPAKRGRKIKGLASRGPTRANSPSVPRPVLTRCQHLFCVECYRSCICPGWPGIAQETTQSCSACQTSLKSNDAVEVKPDCTLETLMRKKAVKREKRQKGVNLEHFHPSTKVKALLGDLAVLSKSNPYSVNHDPNSIEVQMVDEKGNDINDGVVKTVVFSQWTSMLDKVEDALEAAGIRYDRLDGTMKRDERSRAMDALKYDPGCEVLLVSLKAGGVGLNLTAAQRVYLMDPYWNPAVENQAVDRIHRLGQTKPVTTIRLIIENSIEAKLLEVQKKKTALANMTLGQTFSKAEMLQRRLEELSELFGS